MRRNFILWAALSIATMGVAQAEVRSLEVGIDTTCPYGLLA